MWLELFFLLSEQTLDSIVIVSDPVKSKQGANFPIEPYVVLELQDAAGRRIFSGQDSSLTINVAASDNSACLSTDSATLVAKDGRAIFVGSFCAPLSNVSLSFSTTSAISANLVTSGSTATFEVTDDVYLGNYIDYYSSGSTSDTGPNIDSFVWHALEDIKANIYPHLLPGRNLHINSYNTNNDPVTTAKQLDGMLAEGESTPHKRVRGIIGLGTNALTEGLAPVLAANKIPQIATREDEYGFRDKLTVEVVIVNFDSVDCRSCDCKLCPLIQLSVEVLIAIYPYYNRLSWNIGSLSHSIMMAAAYRNWKKMIIIRQSNLKINNVFIQKAKDFNLEITAEIAIPFIPPPLCRPGLLQTYMDKIKSYGVRIIWMFMIPPFMAFTLCEARSNNMTSYDGYQWGAIGQYGWYFPYANQYYAGCRDPNELPCSTAFKGWIGIDSTYDLNGLMTDHWKRVMERHLFTDRVQKNYRGTNRKNKWLEVLAMYALAYDAVIVYSEALTDLMQKNETITPDKLVKQIRNVLSNFSPFLLSI
ncbi:uncharacterized protein LOC134252475 [Saccostrea cucullata]|uniref:uncharacterized protein LOC134252475 n=1 Tax=Saccostrea cuccullata TaxID=36930 RepID=UPI002ED1B3E1